MSFLDWGWGCDDDDDDELDPRHTTCDPWTPSCTSVSHGSQHRRRRSSKKCPEDIYLPLPYYRPPAQPVCHSQPQVASYPVYFPQPYQPVSCPRLPISANETYASLRDKAMWHSDAMYGCLDQCRQVSKKKRGLKSILYSQAEAHKAEMEKLNNEASELLFAENNQGRNLCRIDLHGLYVDEAIWFTERSIYEAQQRGDTRLYLIVGISLFLPSLLDYLCVIPSVHCRQGSALAQRCSQGQTRYPRAHAQAQPPHESGPAERRYSYREPEWLQNQGQIIFD